MYNIIVKFVLADRGLLIEYEGNLRLKRSFPVTSNRVVDNQVMLYAVC